MASVRLTLNGTTRYAWIVAVLNSPLAFAEPHGAAPAQEERVAQDCLDELTLADKQNLSKMLAELQQMEGVTDRGARDAQIRKIIDKYDAILSSQAKIIAISQAKRYELEQLALTMASDEKFSELYQNLANAMNNSLAATEQATQKTWDFLGIRDAYRMYKGSDGIAKAVNEEFAARQAFENYLASIPQDRLSDGHKFEIRAAVREADFAKNRQFHHMMESWDNRMESSTAKLALVRDGGFALVAIGSAVLSGGTASGGALVAGTRVAASIRSMSAAARVLKAARSASTGAGRLLTAGGRTVQFAKMGAGVAVGLPAAKQATEALLNSLSLGTTFTCELAKSFDPTERDLLKNAFNGAAWGASFAIGLAKIPGLVKVTSAALVVNSGMKAVDTGTEAIALAATDDSEAGVRLRNKRIAQTGEHLTHMMMARDGYKAGKQAQLQAGNKTTGEIVEGSHKGEKIEFELIRDPTGSSRSGAKSPETKVIETEFVDGQFVPKATTPKGNELALPKPREEISLARTRHELTPKNETSAPRQELALRGTQEGPPPARPVPPPTTVSPSFPTAFAGTDNNSEPSLGEMNIQTDDQGAVDVPVVPVTHNQNTVDTPSVEVERRPSQVYDEPVEPKKPGFNWQLLFIGLGLALAVAGGAVLLKK